MIISNEIAIDKKQIAIIIISLEYWVVEKVYTFFFFSFCSFVLVYFCFAVIA